VLEEYTVFESEVVGAILAIKGTSRLTSVDIFTDCQLAIIALSAPKPQLGQYLLVAFHLLHWHLLCPLWASTVCRLWQPPKCATRRKEETETMVRMDGGA
jgi:hypothetical protein